LAEEKEVNRLVWSCQLCQLPEEGETERLADALRGGALPCWEDAVLLKRYIALTGASQSACARTLGRSQASVANRLRLLKLPEDVRETMRREKLTERHARALLRLTGAARQRAALLEMVRRGMNVAAAEGYVEKLLSGTEPPEREPDALAAALSALERLQRAEPEISLELRDRGKEVLVTLSIPKKMLK